MAGGETHEWGAKLEKITGPRRTKGTDRQKVIVRQVWADNVVEEFNLIQSKLREYTVAALDTEFPGEVADPFPHRPYYTLSPTENYQKLKANVDVLNIIQLGLALSDHNGTLPNFDTPYGCVWEFNFNNFDLEHHPHNPLSIDLLMNQGIDVRKHRERGIDSKLFASLLFNSGLVHRKSFLSWYTFHGAYDFGFMIKLLSGKDLPANLEDFLNLVTGYFGEKVYDLKHIIRLCDGLHGGLERVANKLEIVRIAGKTHQAGSDSLLTLQASFKIWMTFASQSLEQLFLNHRKRDLLKYGLQGVLYGLEIDRASPMKLLENEFED